MAAGNEKRTIWGNQDIKEAIQAKKDAFMTLLQSRSSSDNRSRYFDPQRVFKKRS